MDLSWRPRSFREFVEFGSSVCFDTIIIIIITWVAFLVRFWLLSTEYNIRRPRYMRTDNKASSTDGLTRTRSPPPPQKKKGYRNNAETITIGPLRFSLARRPQVNMRLMMWFCLLYSFAPFCGAANLRRNFPPNVDIDNHLIMAY